MLTIQQDHQPLVYQRTAQLQVKPQPVDNIDTLNTVTTQLTPLSTLHDPVLLDLFDYNNNDDPDSASSNETLMVVSPYRSREHLLNLSTLQPNQQLLAKALTALHPIRPDYAICPYHAAFNWDTVIDHLRTLAQAANYTWITQQFYIVVFRSQIPPTTDRVHLAALDRAAHIEATKSGGLLRYWFGVPDQTGRNLATCVWRKQSDARPGSVGPGHKAAMRATMSMYTEWKVERLKLVIEGDGSGIVEGWSISQWEERDG